MDSHKWLERPTLQGEKSEAERCLGVHEKDSAHSESCAREIGKAPEHTGFTKVKDGDWEEKKW